MTDDTHNASTTAEYAVGYGRPPKETQFKPGQSGNPKGRPKHTRNFKTDLREELDSMIRVQEGGRDLVISKQRALVKRHIELALNGDIRAINTLTVNISKVLGMEDIDEAEKTLPEEDKAILERYRRRITNVDDSERGDN